VETQGFDRSVNGIPSDCDTLRELLPAYSIGATDAAETQLVESLLAVCPEVTDDLQDFMQLSEAMAYIAPPIPPPANLHDKLMVAVAQRPAASAPKIAQPIPQPASASTNVRWLTPAIARFALAAAAVLLVINVVLLARLLNLSGKQQEQDDQIAQLNSEINQQNQFFADLATGRATTIELRGDTGDTLASVIWSPASNQALLISNGLPSLEADRTYQLWLIRDNQPVSGGLFQVDATGRGTLIFESATPLNDYDALGITNEPMTGSEAPTTAPIALTEV
jgi:anti-sigma-K factor RskA